MLVNLILFSVIIALLFCLYVLLTDLIDEVKSQTQHPQNPKKMMGQRGRKKGRERSNSKLERKSLVMLHGNRSTAARLISGAKQSHPNKPKDWYLEKVIGNLERDRRWL